MLKTMAFKALKTSNKRSDSREVSPMIALGLYFDSFQTAVEETGAREETGRFPEID